VFCGGFFVGRGLLPVSGLGVVPFGCFPCCSLVFSFWCFCSGLFWLPGVSLLEELLSTSLGSFY
jgi:hypothetical protein